MFAFVPWRGRLCSSYSPWRIKIPQYFEMIHVFNAQDVWVQQSVHIDLYREVSRQSHGPETSRKAVSIRCALPAVPVEWVPSTVGWRPGDLQTVIWSLILPNTCCEALVCSLDQREIFTIYPKHVSNMSYCMSVKYSIRASSLSLLPWSHSSGFIDCKFWQVLWLSLRTNSLLVLLTVYFTRGFSALRE